jgi:hypothetical protein
MRERKPARVTQQGAGPSLPDAIQHGPTRTLPKTRRCKTPEHNHGRSGDAHAPPALACETRPFDPGPLAITLTMTMPDRWANINAAAFWPVDCDPICWTCDIRATVRAATTNIGPALATSRAVRKSEVLFSSGARAIHLGRSRSRVTR